MIALQRLEIVWRPNILGTSPPLTDEAHYFEFHVKECADELHLVAVGCDDEGGTASEHVVPFSLVRSASARPIPEPTP